MKMKIIIVLLLSLPMTSFSQFDKLVNTLNDAVKTVANGQLTLVFINAETGKSVDDASVEINEIGTFTTNLSGRIVFDSPNDATYKLKFNKEGFIPANYSFEVVSGEIPDNKITVSRNIKPDAIRIVLVWGKEPRDLDAHFLKQDDYQISAKNFRISKDETAKLDRSANTSYGPETITATNIDNQSAYTYSVENFSGKDSPKSLALSKSGAMVQVYKNNQLLKMYIVPTGQRGTVWTVFTIENGVIIDKNEVGN